jgi:hypothetical protein
MRLNAQRSRFILRLLGVIAFLLTSLAAQNSVVKADLITGSPVTVNGSVCFMDSNNQYVFANNSTNSGIEKFRTSDLSKVSEVAFPVNTPAWVSSVSDIGFQYGNGVPRYTGTQTLTRFVPSTFTNGASIEIPHAATAFSTNLAGTKAYVVGWRIEETASGIDGKLSIIDLSNNSVETISLGAIKAWNVTLMPDEENIYVGGEVGSGWNSGKILKVSSATHVVTDFYSSTWPVLSITNDSTFLYAAIMSTSRSAQENTAIVKLNSSNGQVLNTLTKTGQDAIRLAASPDENFLYFTQDKYLSKVNLSTFVVAQNLQFASSPECFIIANTGSFGVVSLGYDNGYSNNVQKITLTSTESQSINLSDPGPLLFGTRSVNINASATSGLNITLNSSTPSVCSVSGSLVTFLGIGSCTINGNQTGGSGWAAASSISRTFSILAQTVSFSAPETILSGINEINLSATATSGLPVTFQSATQSVCTVIGVRLTVIKKGTCLIDANQSGDSNWDTATTVRKSILILLSPPIGEPGASILDGAVYTNNKSVKLNLIWPAYATEARISNDGGFAASKTKTVQLESLIDWDLDDSVKGLYTKVVYVRFNGSGIDTTKTYSDDIILDTNPPVMESSSAAAVSGSIDLTLKATDDITGVDKVEIKNGTTTVTKDYATKVSVPLADLLLSVSSMDVQKLAATSIEVRVSDNAGNWSAYKALSVPGVVATRTAAAPTVTKSKSATAKSIAQYAKLTVLTTSKVSIKVVSGYTKFCKVSGTTLKGIKAGTCKVTVTVTPKKGKATTKTVTLKVTG